MGAMGAVKAPQAYFTESAIWKDRSRWRGRRSRCSFLSKASISRQSIVPWPGCGIPPGGCPFTNAPWRDFTECRAPSPLRRSTAGSMMPRGAAFRFAASLDKANEFYAYERKDGVTGGELDRTRKI